MAANFSMDNKIVTGAALAVSTGIALYSTAKLWKLQRKIDQENIYESEKYLNEYLIFHFGKPEEVLTYDFGPQEALDFPVKCSDICLKYFSQVSEPQNVAKRALDIGCAVGRSSFEMTQLFNEVVGIDYSHSFVNACNALKVSGKLPYSVTTEGDLVKHLEAVVPSSLNRERCTFRQGDACDLPEDLGQFGCILAANLICRLHTPKLFFDRMKQMVAPGGILVVTSPYTFSREYTPRDNWIGAYMRDGKPFTAFDGMKEMLAGSFELVADEEVSFFIRETAHKNQWTVAHVTIWKKL